MKQRNTKQKQLVLQTVQAHHDHPTADQIYLEIRAQDSRVSRGTVYRNLSQMAQAGLITHVKVPGADRFDCRPDRHFHLVCSACGAVCDAPIAYQAALDDLVFEKTGFQVERHRTIFEGLCPACQARLAAVTQTDVSQNDTLPQNPL